MQKGINKVILVGHLGKDPEIKSTSDGRMLANISVATSESWNDKNTGQKQEITEWHRVTVFGKLAEIVEKYLRKGSLVYFEGKLQTRKWQDQNGQERYSTDIVVDGFSGVMQMLGARGVQTDERTPAVTTSQTSTQPGISQTSGALPSIVDNFDDVPF